MNISVTYMELIAISINRFHNRSIILYSSIESTIFYDTFVPFFSNYRGQHMLVIDHNAIFRLFLFEIRLDEA